MFLFTYKRHAYLIARTPSPLSSVGRTAGMTVNKVPLISWGYEVPLFDKPFIKKYPTALRRSRRISRVTMGRPESLACHGDIESLMLAVLGTWWLTNELTARG
jgi:hypothetical protein